jgi:hypothetical protein
MSDTIQWRQAAITGTKAHAYRLPETPETPRSRPRKSLCGTVQLAANEVAAQADHPPTAACKSCVAKLGDLL